MNTDWEFRQAAENWCPNAYPVRVIVQALGAGTLGIILGGSATDKDVTKVKRLAQAEAPVNVAVFVKRKGLAWT